MILKNLFRRKVRTLLTVLGISIGVAAIVGLGALANGLEAGYNSIISGSQADLILSQQDAIDLSTSTVEASIGNELAAMSEVSAVSGMLQGFVQAESIPYFFVYGYPEKSFALERFQIVDGVSLDSHEAQKLRGKPVLLGSAAAEVLDKAPWRYVALDGKGLSGWLASMRPARPSRTTAQSCAWTMLRTCSVDPGRSACSTSSLKI